MAGGVDRPRLHEERIRESVRAAEEIRRRLEVLRRYVRLVRAEAGLPPEPPRRGGGHAG